MTATFDQQELSPGGQDAFVDAMLHGRPRAQTRTVFGRPEAELSAAEVERRWSRLLSEWPWLRWVPSMDAGGAAFVEGGEPSLSRIAVADGDPAEPLVARAQKFALGLSDTQRPNALCVLLLAVDEAAVVRGIAVHFHRALMDDRSAHDILDALLEGREVAYRAAEAQAETAPWQVPAWAEGAGGIVVTEATESCTDPRRLTRPAAASLLPCDLPAARLRLLAGWARVVATLRGESAVLTGVWQHCDNRRANGERVLPVPVRLTRQPVAEFERSIADQLAASTALGALARLDIEDLFGTEVARICDVIVDLRSQWPDRRTYGSVPSTAVLAVDAGGLRMDFDPDRIPERRAERLLDLLERALAGFAQQPQLPVSDVELVDEHERARVLVDLNQTESDYPDACLHEIVEATADRYPDRIALVDEHTTMTYRELDWRANGMAARLRELGVGPDSIVGLCTNPSIASVVATLAILKAGGAYAPLDPSYPDERLHYIAEDLDCTAVVVDPDLAARLPELSCPWVRTDEYFNGYSASRVSSNVTPANLAYVMYTSGSTGRPKGVLVEHRGAVNFVWWISQQHTLEPEGASLQWTAYSFDAAVWELFWPLFVGAKVVVAPAGLHLDLDRFVRLIVGNRVVTLHFVPAMLQVFLTSPNVSECRSLRHVFVSGESLPPSLVSRFHQALDADLINLYGVTEVSIDSTFQVTRRDRVPAVIPAGRPISNTAVYVLDDNLHPVPVGARGQVYLGGDSVARGYLNRPGLTADRFLPDPYAESGERMYRTGDHAELTEGGSLLFLGRSDHQVKVRGIRIELPEVEAELGELPGVRDCLVVPWGDHSDRSLAAYVVPDSGSTGRRLDAEQVRRLIGERVPGYMVPTSVVLLDEFPISTNGKIDRVRLPAPDAGLAFDAGAAPQTPTEEAIAGIWADVLGTERPVVDVDFFALGGNSLLSAVAITRIREHFGVELSMRTWFESRSIRQLALAVEQAESNSADVGAIVDRVVGRRGG